MQGRATANPPALGLAVLYVDDDFINLRVVDDLLGSVGVCVTCASSGPEGLMLLQQQNFDVVLMDIHMPGMTGVETLARLRDLECANRSLPVLALTADLSRGDAEYRALGFDGFVAKPVSLRLLLNAILQAMSASRSQAPVRKRA